MKYLFIPLLLLLLAAPAYAQENGIAMLVIGNANKEAEVYKAPDGAVSRTIPLDGTSDAEIEMRRVLVTEKDGPWFRVRLDDDTLGWMQASALGSCASATEDGGAVMHAEPDEASATLATVPEGTPLRLLDLRGVWAKVEYAESAGKAQSGWIMEQALFANPHNSCWNTGAAAQ